MLDPLHRLFDAGTNFLHNENSGKPGNRRLLLLPSLAKPSPLAGRAPKLMSSQSMISPRESGFAETKRSL